LAWRAYQSSRVARQEAEDHMKQKADQQKQMYQELLRQPSQTMRNLEDIFRQMDSSTADKARTVAEASQKLRQASLSVEELEKLKEQLQFHKPPEQQAAEMREAYLRHKEKALDGLPHKKFVDAISRLSKDLGGEEKTAKK